MTQFPMIAVAVGLVGTPLWLMALMAFDKYREFREPNLLTCPETNSRVAVSLGTSAASDVDGYPAISNCSRWPQRRDCDQACLRHV